MVRNKANYQMLHDMSEVLEGWCNDNLVEWKQCNEYQWNIYVPQVQVIIAIYPGSGVIWVPKAHYIHRGVIDKSSTKHHFTNKKTLLSELQNIIFAADLV